MEIEINLVLLLITFIFCVLLFIRNSQLHCENIDLKGELHALEIENDHLKYNLESNRQWLEKCKADLEDTKENLILCQHPGQIE